ncbi:hypothetical protein MMC22_011596 [Lobaria immixta]|nr:hypothetical protein [Lobaria immixta]
MLFAKALVVGASFVVAALAQSKIQFTSQPSNVKVGVPVEVTWINGDNTPVTITLREGKSTDLQDVEVLTTTGKGGSFTWTPSKSLADGSDYALQISQSGVINFTGQFSISGGSGSKTSASVTKSSSASVTESSSESITSAATTVSLTSSHKSLVVVTSKIALNSSISSIPVIGTGASFGTSGIHITRNQTLSRATLTATKSSAVSTSEAGSGSSGGSGGSGSTEGSSGGANPSATSPTSAPGSSAATLASPLALVLCALVAVVYLG